MSVLKSVIYAAKLQNFTRSVPPPFADPKARHQPWLFPSSSSHLQILLLKPIPGSFPQPEEYVLEGRSHCVSADGWQPVPTLGSTSQTLSLYIPVQKKSPCPAPACPGFPTPLRCLQCPLTCPQGTGEGERSVFLLPPPCLGACGKSGTAGRL